MDISLEDSSPLDASPETTPSKPWVVWGVALASLLAFVVIRSPVPGVNEPHYLSKAKHYWNPDWCPHDFFLKSADTHLVFYQTVGVYTQVLTLEQTAWLGRLVSLGILAWGWVCCARYLVPGRWTSLWALWAYLAMAAVGNWSGEWMIGGVEGKVFAYGFGFWAIAAWFDRHLIRSALLAGLGVSFHPVVGGWFVICAGAAMLATRLFPSRTDQDSHAEPRTFSLGDWIAAAGVFVLASLPGIWPALGLLQFGDQRQTLAATWIQVFHRIRHHLDPMTFSQAGYVTYGLLLLLWLVIRCRGEWGTAERWFAWFVGASVAVAVVGVALGYGDRPIEKLSQITWRYRLLKFYPFRLADVLLPAAASITLAGLAARGLQNGPLPKLSLARKHAERRWWLLFGGLLAFSLAYPAVDRNPSRMSESQLSDWRDVCRWIRENTPKDTVVWTPRRSWAFKWYAERAEYVSRKDCPQDPAGILEWNNRMNHQFREAFRNEKHMNFAIFHRDSLADEPVYENATYRVYDLSGYSHK